ncbi:post-transcriptional regulator [Paenibacillus thermoaerophilus]|uniref:Post-transcriptional regulator n=1 Tax=Paenibacillus thermoaerophilus TaxID=1215385 RepID=A0ABW2UX19_9BACL|nr:post-transcriptional regulator [Paenibacillus thermoaerophilus]
MLERIDRLISEALPYEELASGLADLCRSKAEEFRLLGYEAVTPEDIWDCVRERHKGELPPIHRLVNDILSLKVTQWMNWITMGALKGTGSWR